VLGGEALVHRAVALPEQEAACGSHVVRAEPAEVEAWVPHPHVRLVVAHLEAGVAAQMLVGEEQHLIAAFERPVQHGAGVG
jgi:hypothetical protein